MISAAFQINLIPCDAKTLIDKDAGQAARQNNSVGMAGFDQGLGFNP
jgi:hypothetical protein